MKRKFLPIIFCFFALSVFGQEKEAQKIDEFGNIPCDEYLARIDAVTVQQANNPMSQIYVFVYEGKEEQPIYKKRPNYVDDEFVGYKLVLPQYGLAKAKIESMKKRFKLRKIPLENNAFVNGGFREKFTVEIWLVPPGAEAPKPTPTVQKMKYRKGKAKGFCLECCGV